MNLSVHLYGTIAQAAGHRHLAILDITLPVGATVGDLLQHLNIPAEEVGMVFINAVLHDLPGLHLSLEDELHPNDHVGIFAANYVWPYQYRGGAPMSPRLQAYTRTHDYLRHQPRAADL